ncbi:hypothetical protein Ciccas_013159, partial [Cichlidogyrus casuarinus]
MSKFGLSILVLSCVISTWAQVQKRARIIPGSQWVEPGCQETKDYERITGYILAEFEKVYKTKGTVVKYTVMNRLVVEINAEDCKCTYTCIPLVIMRPWSTSDGPDSIKLNCVKNESIIKGLLIK